MPLLTYRCNNETCNHRMDKIVKYVDRETPRDCSECNGEKTMKYEPFTAGDKGSNLYFHGNWFANTGGY